MGSPATQPTEWRLANLEKEELGTNQMARVCPVGWGRFLVGGTYISDIFNSRNEPITQIIEGARKYGLFGPKKKEEQVVGYNYFGSYAQALSMGPVDKVFAAYAQEETVYSGAITRGGDHFAEISLGIEDSPIGQVELYFGTPLQPYASHFDLDDSGSHSAYRYVCYLLGKELAFGQQTSPPNLTWELGRWPELLDISEHQIEDDAVVPEVIYDVLTNSMYGLGVNQARLIHSSFEQAAERIIDEGLGVSPVLNERKSVRKFCSELMEYVRGGFYRRGDKIGMRLIRPVSVRIPIVATDLAKQLEPDSGSPSSLPNLIAVKFSNRERAYEENQVEYDDTAGREVLKRLVSQDVDRKWITREEVALKVVQYEGRRRVLPLTKMVLELGYEFAGLQPGDALAVTDDKHGFVEFPVIAGNVEIDPPGGGVKVEAWEDQTDLIEDTADLEVDDYGTNPEIDLDDVDFRIALPSSLLLGGDKDGIVIASARQNGLFGNARLSFAWDGDGSWSQLSAEVPSWAISLQLNRWKPAEAGMIQLDITIGRVHEDAFLSSLLSQTELQTELYILTGWRRINTGKDEHGLEACWSVINYGDPVTPHESEARRYYVIVRPGWYASPVFRPVDGETDGVYPSARGYMGPREAFTILSFNQPNFFRSGPNDTTDLAHARYIRMQSRISGRLQPLADAAQASLVRAGGPWVASAVTTHQQIRANAGKLYGRVTEGTSINGSIPPTHGADVVNDGVSWVYVAAYAGVWVSEATTAFGAYYSHDGRLYSRTSAGSSANGTTPPTHTTGTESDGAVDWQYEGVFGGDWVTAAESAWDDYVVNAGNLYQRETGGTSANGPFAPVHITGSEPDGVDWEYLAVTENPYGSYLPNWGAAATLDDTEWGIAASSNPPTESPTYAPGDYAPPSLGGSYLE